VTYPEKQLDRVKACLARRVRALRSEAGLSQEQLALEAGIDRTYVSQIERQICNPSLLVLVKIGDRLGVEVCDLLKE
jgi:transcriptional regulator with XRE-family HTH domain